MMSQKHLGGETFDCNKDVYHVYMKSIQKLNRFIFFFLYFTLVFSLFLSIIKKQKIKSIFLLNQLHGTALIDEISD